jgi:Uma2 family endonuclease
MVTRSIAPWAEPVPGVDREITADELLAWPDDGWQYELVEGRLVRMPPTGYGHTSLAMRTFGPLFRFVDAQDLGLLTLPDTGFRLSVPGHAETVLSPDIAFLSAAKVALLPPKESEEWAKYIAIPPDLAIEIPSPDQYRPEMAAKARLYLALGVKLVWVLWERRKGADIWRPGSAHLVATLGVDDSLDGEDVLPGFTLPLAQLFA